MKLNIQQLLSIPDRNDKGAETTNYSYGIDATWTVFDGLTMFATQDRLSLEENIGNEQAASDRRSVG